MNVTQNYVKQFSSSRIFFGVGGGEDQGLCYYNQALPGVDETLQQNQFVNKYTIEDDYVVVYKTRNDMPFFNFSSIDNTKVNGIYQNSILDNILTYEDNISWGCLDKLNRTGLKYYCTNQLWKQKMLFNIAQNISFFSKFGNPNNNLILDWVEIEKFSLDDYQSIWDETYNRCYLPAVLNIDIMYATYGLVNNTQVGIFKVYFRMDYIYWWAKNILDERALDNFFTYINVNSIRIPQEKVWWYAPPPQIITLPRNVLYPFRLGTTTYGRATTSDSFIKISYKLAAFLLLFNLLINY